MNESRLAFYRVLIGLSLVLAAVSSLKSQEAKPLSTQQVAAIRKAVATPTPVRYLVAKEDFTGDFQTIQANIEKFVKDFKEQRLDTAVEKAAPTALLIYKENPDEKKEFAYSVGLVIPAGVKVNAPLSIQSLQYAAAVSVTHKGPNYQELGSIYKNIADLQANKPESQRPKFPVVVELLNDPARVPNDQVLTKLVVPVGEIKVE